MPHIIVECSPNIKEKIGQDLLTALHRKTIEHGIPAERLQTRMTSREGYVIGDENPDNSLLHIYFSILKGRGRGISVAIGKDLFAVAQAYVAEKGLQNCVVTQRTDEIEDDLYNR